MRAVEGGHVSVPTRIRHLDYTHFNPVKHEHGQCAVDWPHSTFHRYVRDGVYAHNWAAAMASSMPGYD